VVAIVRGLLAAGAGGPHMGAGDVGVITPYSGQVRCAGVALLHRDIPCCAPQRTQHC
jgi:hypothetical protein